MLSDAQDLSTCPYPLQRPFQSPAYCQPPCHHLTSSDGHYGEAMHLAQHLSLLGPTRAWGGSGRHVPFCHVHDPLPRPGLRSVRRALHCLPRWKARGQEGKNGWKSGIMQYEKKCNNNSSSPGDFSQPFPLTSWITVASQNAQSRIPEGLRLSPGSSLRIQKGCLQSRCFFLGPITSCVVALQTALATADPVTLYWAAAMRSVSVWPDIFGCRSCRCLLCRGRKHARGRGSRAAGRGEAGAAAQSSSGPPALLRERSPRQTIPVRLPGAKKRAISDTAGIGKKKIKENRGRRHKPRTKGGTKGRKAHPHITCPRPAPRRLPGLPAPPRPEKGTPSAPGGGQAAPAPTCQSVLPSVLRPPPPPRPPPRPR